MVALPNPNKQSPKMNSPAAQAIKYLRVEKRYYLWEISQMLAEEGARVGRSMLCRIEGGSRKCKPDAERALVKIHNKICKRSERINHERAGK
jgi:hypothetical protein